MKTNASRPSRPRSEQLRHASTLALAMLLLAGCNTTGYKQSDAAAWNSQVAQQEVQAESRELEATLGTLTALVNQPAPDARPQFLEFSAALDRLGASARRAGGGVNRMWRKRAAYFEIWDKQIAAIQNEEIRQTSQARKVEVGNQFDSANRTYDEAQRKLDPLISYLLDIRKALSTDLTRQGLAAAQPSVANANTRAREVQSALAQSASELDTLGARTASFRVQDLK